MVAVLPCQDCGLDFEALRSDTKRCRNCRATARKEYLREYDHGKRRGTCVDCGADIGERAERCRQCANRVYSGDGRYGANNSNWKQGRSESKGYVLVRTGHVNGGAAYTPQHRLVWEQSHGQTIPKGFVVHHLNGIKTDNRPENLVAMSRHYHHHHPREALRPYETRIAALEEYIRSIGHEPPVGELPEVDEDHSH